MQRPLSPLRVLGIINLVRPFQSFFAFFGFQTRVMKSLKLAESPSRPRELIILVLRKNQVFRFVKNVVRPLKKDRISENEVRTSQKFGKTIFSKNKKNRILMGITKFFHFKNPNTVLPLNCSPTSLFPRIPEKSPAPRKNPKERNGQVT